MTLEDAFIAAYLVGVRDLSTPDLRVTAARIMGIESDHRTLARVIGPDVPTANGGPIEKITGIQGAAESVDPPNNNGYERTLQWTNINSAVTALTPFLDKSAAGKAGFDTTKPYQFVPFMPVLPSPLGDFTPSSAEGQTASAAAASAHSRCRGARGPGNADGSAPRRSPPLVSGNNAVRFI